MQYDISAMTFGPDGNLYVGFDTEPIMRVFDGGSLARTTERSMQYDISAMTFGPDGNLYVGFDTEPIMRVLDGGSLARITERSMQYDISAFTFQPMVVLAVREPPVMGLVALALCLFWLLKYADRCDRFGMVAPDRIRAIGIQEAQN